MKSFKIYTSSFVILLLLALVSIVMSIGKDETFLFFKTNPVALFGVFGAIAIATINPFYAYQKRWKAFIIAIIVQLLLCGLLFLVDMKNNGAWIATGVFVAFLIISTPIALMFRKAFGAKDYPSFE